MAMKMNSKQKKISKVMREFKKGELNIGGSSKKVKNPKQAIAIALSEAGKSKKMASGGSAKPGLWANINRRKRLGISRSKSESTISPKAYANMKKGFLKKK